MIYRPPCLPHTTPHSRYSSYVPVGHWNASSGTWACGEGLDCPGTAFDSCMAAEYCWYGDCEASVQAQLSTYLHCFEGPFANLETTTNDSRRPACLQRAQLDAAPIEACTADAPKLKRIMDTLNASKAAMYRGLGPSPGYFPHIYVDGEHQANFAWTALTRTLCARRDARGFPPAPEVCGSTPLNLSIGLKGTKLTAAEWAAEGGWTKAVAGGVDKAITNASFPFNFDDADYALLAQAVRPGDVAFTGAEEDPSGTGVVHGNYKFASLAHFAGAARAVGSGDGLPCLAKWLAEALSSAGAAPGLSSANVAYARITVV